MTDGLITRQMVQKTQQKYLTEVVKRNKQEKEFFKGFVEDYCAVLKELKDNKDWLAQQRAENEQIKTMKGDPIALKKAREELNNLRGQVSQNDLNIVTDRLQLTEAKAQLGQENRELMREKLAMERRLTEVEELLTDKGNRLEQAEKELESTQSQFQGMKSALIMYEEKNKKLMADNQEYVKQMISMKESRANLMNDVLSGQINSEAGQRIQSNMSAEESKLGEIIKPEYLRPSNEETTMPGRVAWRACAHQTETTCLTFNRDGNILYTGGGDGLVKSWDTASGRPL